MEKTFWRKVLHIISTGSTFCSFKVRGKMIGRHAFTGIEVATSAGNIFSPSYFVNV